MKTLDLRAVLPAEQAAAVLRGLESVPLGTPVGVLADRPLYTALAALQDRYPSDFDWHVLQDGPPAWRVEIALRAGEPCHGVADLLGEDHRRLDALLEALLAPRGATVESFLEFRTGLARHIRIEEEVLFPIFERRTGVTGGSVEAVRQEHREIEALLEGLERRIRDGHGAGEAGIELRELLVQHHAREEEVLYVMTDRQLEAGERAELIRRMQRI